MHWSFGRSRSAVVNLEPHAGPIDYLNQDDAFEFQVGLAALQSLYALRR